MTDSSLSKIDDVRLEPDVGFTTAIVYVSVSHSEVRDVLDGKLTAESAADRLTPMVRKRFASLLKTIPADVAERARAYEPS